jgi:biotin synthase
MKEKSMQVSEQVSEQDKLLSLQQTNQTIDKAELIELLQARGELQQELFRRARLVRKHNNLDNVLVRGVIEISNFCQKNCDYCAMRAVNQNLDRYRMSATEILEIAAEIRKANISIAFLQSGQDRQCDETIAEVIPEIKKMGLHVLLCLGERPREVFDRFAQLGADSYILKFETSDPKIYQDIANTPLSRRLECLEWLREAGYQIGTGNIVGLPNQTLDTLAEDILLAHKLRPDFISASPFIPNGNTPLEKLAYGSLDLTLNTLAIYRILLPTARIPTVSALEKIQKGGQLMGFNAGANIMTINFTPPRRRDLYTIYSDKRFVVSLDHAIDTIDRAGLKMRLLNSEEFVFSN